MTDNNDSDADLAQTLPLTRRQALAGLGAGLLTGAGAAGSIAQDDPLTAREARWTARRRNRAASTLGERTVDALLDEADEQLPDVPLAQYDFREMADEQLADTVGNTVDDRAIPLHTVDSVSQLHYLGARWDPHSNPTPNTGHEGAWQHTFVLSTLGAAQQLAPLETWVGDDDELIYEADRLQFRPHENLYTQPGLRVMATANSEYDDDPRPFTGESFTVDEEPEDATDDGQGQEHVAVSARRDLNLFGFASPDWLSDRAADDATLDALFNSIAAAPDDAIANYAVLMQSMYDAADHREDVGAVGQIASGLLGIASALGSRGVIDSKYQSLGVLKDGEFTPGDLANGGLFSGFTTTAGQAYKIADSLSQSWQDLSDETTYDRTERRFYHGFEQWLPGAGPLGLGFVMFDVYVAPGRSGQVEVSAANRLLDDENPPTDEEDLAEYPITSQTWRLSFDALSAPSEGEDVSTAAKYNAEVEDTAFRVTDASGSLSDEFPFNYLSRQERPAKPGPAITPIADESGGEPDRVAAGSTPTFSAHDTALARGPIVRYEWSIHQCYRNAAGELVERPAYDELTGSQAEFSPTIEAPGADDADTQRVKLTVYDEYTSASTQFDFPVGAPEASEPTVAVSPEQPIVGEPVTFEVDVDMPGDAVSYSWNVTDRPDELQHAPRDLYTGTGETFSFSPPVEGSYSVTVRATDDLGAEALATATISATDGVAVSIDAPESVAPGDDVTLAAEVLGDATVDAYDWSVFGESASGQRVTATFEEGDDPTASVTVTTADGSTASAATELTVQDMAVTLTGPDQLQVGETGTVEASVSGAEADLNYGFSNVDPVNSSARTSPTREVTFDEPGEETVSVTAVEIGDDNERASDELAITVGETEPLSIEGPSSVTVGESVAFEATGGPAAASYDWELFGETATGQTVSATYENGDEPIVSVTATGPDGATASASAELTVSGSTPTYDADVLEGSSADRFGFNVYRDGERVVVRIAGGGVSTGTFRFDVAASDGTVSDVRKDSWNPEETLDDSADDRVSGSGRIGRPGGYDQFSFEPDAAALTFDLQFAETSDSTDSSEVEPRPRPDLVYLGGDETNPDAVPFRVELDAADSVGPIDGYEPTDQDGDGLYEDVTGDGTVGQTDVVEFFRHQHREDWKRPDWFDFTGNGTVGHGDVIELFKMVAKR